MRIRKGKGIMIQVIKEMEKLAILIYLKLVLQLPKRLRLQTKVIQKILLTYYH